VLRRHGTIRPARPASDFFPSVFLRSLCVVRRARSSSFLLRAVPCWRGVLPLIHSLIHGHLCSLPTLGLVRVRLHECSYAFLSYLEVELLASGQLQTSVHEVLSHVPAHCWCVSSPVALQPPTLGYLGISNFSHPGGYGFNFNFPGDEWGGVPLSSAYWPFGHSLLKCCSDTLPVFIIGLFISLVCRNSLYILDTDPVGLHASQIYFVSLWFAFSLSWWSLMWTGVLNFNKAHFISVFYYKLVLFCVLFKKSFSRPRSRYSPVFSCRSFILSFTLGLWFISN